MPRLRATDQGIVLVQTVHDEQNAQARYAANYQFSRLMDDGPRAAGTLKRIWDWLNEHEEPPGETRLTVWTSQLQQARYRDWQERQRDGSHG